MKDYAFLLNRPEHTFHETQIDAALAGKRVLVTGAGGSIGSAIVRRLVNSPVRFIGLVGHSEAPIFNLLQMLGGLNLRPAGQTVQPSRVQSAVADVGHAPSMRDVMRVWEPDIIIHAAAHKHVALMERQPLAAFKNNTIATLQLAQIALESRSVRKFVFISTDKAVRPTSVMGASKRLAEVGLQQRFAPFATICRFGNVLGSAGSLVEIIEKSMAEDKVIFITDLRMQRYFITAKEAVGLVLTAGLLEEGGCFSLHMGNPVNVMEIVRKMGNPKFETGLPGTGEKFDEEVLFDHESFFETITRGVLRVVTSKHPDADAAIAQVLADPSAIVRTAQSL